MESKTCNIKIITDGSLGRVYVDGADVTKGCCGYEITHCAGALPTVKLEFAPDRLEIESKGAVVEHA